MVSFITHCRREIVICLQQLKDTAIKKQLPSAPQKKTASLLLFASGMPAEMFSLCSVKDDNCFSKLKTFY